MKKSRLPYAILTMLLLSLSARPAVAQQPYGTPVHMVVTVEARHGSVPPEISREDVMVYEGKTRDMVTEWIPAEGDRAALELFILLDDSSNTSQGAQLEDLRQFIVAQPATSKVGVAYMRDAMGFFVNDPRRQFTDQKADDIVFYLNHVFGEESVLPKSPADPTRSTTNLPSKGNRSQG